MQAVYSRGCLVVSRQCRSCCVVSVTIHVVCYDNNMAAKKKSSNDGKGTKAQVDALKKAPSRKPTEAISKSGQKATGLAKSSSSDRFSSNAKTKVKSATSGFAGSGTPLGSSMGINPLNKGQIANAALTAVALPGSGQVRNYVAGKAGGRVADAAFKASTKGFEASGAGGKVKNVMTPMGKTLGSTRIGSPAQQAASMGNLEIAKAKEAVRAGADISRQVVRGMNQAGKLVKGAAVTGLVGKTVASKIKKNTKK